VNEYGLKTARGPLHGASSGKDWSPRGRQIWARRTFKLNKEVIKLIEVESLAAILDQERDVCATKKSSRKVSESSRLSVRRIKFKKTPAQHGILMEGH